MGKLLILLMLLLTPSLTYAAPSITGVNGTVSNGQSISISGSGFGTKSSAAPLAYGDMENASLDARIGSWAANGARVLTLTSNNPRSSNSSYSALGTFTAGDQYAAFENATRANTFYASYYFRLNSPWTWGTDPATSFLGNLKFFRLWNSSSDNLDIAFSGVSDVTMVWETFNTSTYWAPEVTGYNCVDAIFGRSCQGWIDPTMLGWHGATSSDVTLNTWHKFDFEYVDGAANTANGTMRIWFNNRLIFSRSDVLTRATASTKYPFILGIYNAHGTGSATMQLDDVYVDTTLQRIEIGDNATYDSCTHREIQPPTAWSDTGVTFTVNQGSFANSSTGYVFVTDANGTRNTGYQVTFGSASVINGACGSASGQSYTSLSSGSAGLCSTGTVASFSGSGPWTWGCDGSGGGTSTSSTACSASLTTYGASLQTTVTLGKKDFITGVVK